MNLFTRLSCLLLAVTLPVAVQAELSMRLQPVGANASGGFRAQPNDDFQWVLAYYEKGTAKVSETRGHPSIGIFSLDSAPSISPGHEYQASVKAGIRTNGQAGISAASAFLYESYATGRLASWLPGFSYDERSATTLQNAILALEGAGGADLAPAVSDFLVAHFGSLTLANETYRGSAIRVLTLTATDGSGQSSDFLVYIPDANPLDERGMPVIGNRAAGGGGGGGGRGGGGPLDPGVIVVNPPDEKFNDVIDDIVTNFPPVSPPSPEDDITGSTPPGPPGPDLKPDDLDDPINPPTIDPTDDSRQPVSVSDNGFTALLLIAGLGSLLSGRRRFGRR